MLSGVFYVNTEAPSGVDLLNLVEQPISLLTESEVRPAKQALKEIIEALR